MLSRSSVTVSSKSAIIIKIQTELGSANIAKHFSQDDRRLVAW